MDEKDQDFIPLNGSENGVVVEDHLTDAISHETGISSNSHLVKIPSAERSMQSEDLDAAIPCDLNVSVQENLKTSEEFRREDDSTVDLSAPKGGVDLRVNENQQPCHENDTVLQENVTKADKCGHENEAVLQENVTNTDSRGQGEDSLKGRFVNLTSDSNVKLEGNAESTKNSNVSSVRGRLNDEIHVNGFEDTLSLKKENIYDRVQPIEDMDTSADMDTSGRVQSFDLNETSGRVQSFDLNETLQPVGEMVQIDIPSVEQCFEASMGPERCSLKRSRSSCFNSTPSVEVIYNCLTSESKNKLKELLKYWSEWHGIFVEALEEGSVLEPLESGKETYFPALRLGGSLMNVWMDKPSKHARTDTDEAADPLGVPMQEKEKEVPLYDRAGVGALISKDTDTFIEGSLDRVDDDSRCFNCGSYSHSMNQCPRPRDATAINSARKQLAEKRGFSRNACRYYQCSPGGKFDGLKPGVLGRETRQLLGIGELDPPPWLHRMRVLGYPPGYLEDQEEEPSGITIFGTEEDDKDGNYIGEDGEIVGSESKKSSTSKKMSVCFPGVNAPIPDDADRRTWGSPLSDYDRHDRSSRRRPTGADADDWDGPPGVSRDSYSKSSRMRSPSGEGASGSGKRSSSTKSPHVGRSSSDIGRSPKVSYEDSHSSRGSYSSSRHSPRHHSPSKRRSPHRHEYHDDALEGRRRAWAKAREALDAVHHSSRTRSPSRRH